MPYTIDTHDGVQWERVVEYHDGSQWQRCPRGVAILALAEIIADQCYTALRQPVRINYEAAIY